MKPEDSGGHDKQKRVEVYWTTVTYKTVALYISLAFAIILLALYLISPERFLNVVARIGESVAGNKGPVEGPAATQARFVQLEHPVQIKKVNSVQWVKADFPMTLEKGDLIQTGSGGNARLTFPDGTTYTVKEDTLITVEENSMTQTRQTNVAVHVQSGAVDLSTGTFEPGSRSEVSFENARAQLQQNTRAAVRSDPEGKQHEITVTQGQAELNRGGQQISIAPFERISFPTGGQPQRSQVMAPPEPVKPVNLSPITEPNPKRAAINFQWKPVSGAVSYTLRVSRTTMFTQIVAEKKTSTNSTDVSGLDAGDYFWHVIATDTQRRISEPSETFKFSLITQGKAEQMLLEVESTQLYGNQVEIVGRTEPGATIIINGQQVTNIQPDGRFRYFTPPLPRGSTKITIVGSNRRGGSKVVELQKFIS